DDVGARRRERRQRVAVRLSRRDRLAVRLELRRADRERRGRPLRRTRRLEGPRWLVADLGERAFRLLDGERFPVPAGLVLDERDALPLDRARDDRSRPFRIARLLVRLVDLDEIVAVDDERVPAERLD